MPSIGRFAMSSNKISSPSFLSKLSASEEKLNLTKGKSKKGNKKPVDEPVKKNAKKACCIFHSIVVPSEVEKSNNKNVKVKKKKPLAPNKDKKLKNTKQNKKVGRPRKTDGPTKKGKSKLDSKNERPPKKKVPIKDNKKNKANSHDKSKNGFDNGVCLPEDKIKKEPTRLVDFKIDNSRIHRVASLNALAKVHLLYENDTRSSNGENAGTVAIYSPKKVVKVSPSKGNRDKVSQSSVRVKRKIDDVEIIDTRSCKRMANLNAQAILAASYKEEKVKRERHIKTVNCVHSKAVSRTNTSLSSAKRIGVTEYREVTKVQINTTKEMEITGQRKIDSSLNKSNDDAIMERYLQTKATSKSYCLEMETTAKAAAASYSPPLSPIGHKLNQVHLSPIGVLHNSQGFFKFAETTVLPPSSQSFSISSVPIVTPVGGPFGTPFTMPHFGHPGTVSYPPSDYGFYTATSPVIQPIHDGCLLHEPVSFHVPQHLSTQSSASAPPPAHHHRTTCSANDQYLSRHSMTPSPHQGPHSLGCNLEVLPSPAHAYSRDTLVSTSPVSANSPILPAHIQSQPSHCSSFGSCPCHLQPPVCSKHSFCGSSCQQENVDSGLDQTSVNALPKAEPVTPVETKSDELYQSPKNLSLHRTPRVTSSLSMLGAISNSKCSSLCLKGKVSCKSKSSYVHIVEENHSALATRDHVHTKQKKSKMNLPCDLVTSIKSKNLSTKSGMKAKKSLKFTSECLNLSGCAHRKQNSDVKELKNSTVKKPQAIANSKKSNVKITLPHELQLCPFLHKKSMQPQVTLPRLVFPKLGKKKFSNGWSWDGQPFERLIYLSNDDPPTLRNCFSGMQHIEGDIIRVGECVLLKSGPKKTDLPFVAKVTALWENPDDGEMMMSLLWYYRPEHTEQGRKPHHMEDEIFASKHKDINSVACIEDKCYVLTFTEYCRHRSRMKMMSEGIGPNSTCVPLSGEDYQRRKRLPPSSASSDMILFCRKVYDFRQKRILKNPT